MNIVNSEKNSFNMLIFVLLYITILGCKSNLHCHSDIMYRNGSPAMNRCDMLQKECTKDVCLLDATNGYINGHSNNVNEVGMLYCLPGYVNNINNYTQINVTWYASIYISEVLGGVTINLYAIR